MSQDLVVSSFPTNIEFQTMKELAKIALLSGFLPTSIKSSEQAIIIMLKGRELSIPPMQAFSSIAVVNGKPTMSAELMLSMIYRNIPGSVVNFIKTDEVECVIEAKRPGGKETIFSFSMVDAKRANLDGKGPWKTYPTAMLRARCISAMARAVFPDALSGVVYTAEELGANVTDDGEIISVPKIVEQSKNLDPNDDMNFAPVQPRRETNELDEFLNDDKPFSPDEPQSAYEELGGHQSKTEHMDADEDAKTQLENYKIGFGNKYKGRTLLQLGTKNVRDYVRYFESNKDPVKGFSRNVEELLEMAKLYEYYMQGKQQ